ncbi:MAG: nucleoside monophosphate kinase [Patescibacteria group bacterium]|nr:nucleoside monophosphate kinase [Patescibacteria group bacterium]MDW8279886.1 nucleoside monophosphate kinase [bacterium]
MNKITIIIFGEPGSGKTTQAKLLVDHFNLIHFDTGRFLESILFDPQRQNETRIQEEKKLFSSGKLNTPSFVVSEIKNKILKIYKSGFGIIFSGSPRTLYEAQKEIPLIEKYSGKENIFFIELKISEKEALKRNNQRLICKFCGYTLLKQYFSIENIKNCPVCGGIFYKRVLDNPEIIKIRFKEYIERTYPIFDFLKKRGFTVHKIDARPAPYKISQKIIKVIESKK